MSHHDLWDFDGNAAPQLTTIKRNGKSIDAVAVAGKTGFLYVFDRVTGVPIWPIEERPVPKSDMPGEQSWPTQPFPTAPPPFSKQTFSPDDINPHPIVSDAEREKFKQRLAASRNQGLFTPIHFDDTLHIPGSNGGALFGYTAAEPANGAVYVISQDNPAILHLVKNPQAGGPPGAAAYQRECAVCHGPDRGGTQTGPSLLDVPGRLDAATVRATIMNGKGRMSAFPHITDVEMETLVTFIVAPPGELRLPAAVAAPQAARSRRGPSSVPEARGCGPFQPVAAAAPAVHGPTLTGSSRRRSTSSMPTAPSAP